MRRTNNLSFRTTLANSANTPNQHNQHHQHPELTPTMTTPCTPAALHNNKLPSSAFSRPPLPLQPPPLLMDSLPPAASSLSPTASVLLLESGCEWSCLTRDERRRLRRATQKYRTAHAARERVRVEAFNTAFGSLRQLLPTLPPDKKLSKIEILRLAICYISYLDYVLKNK